MVLVRHDISSFSPIIARPYNLGGKQQNKHNFMQVEVRTLHRMFCPIVYYKNSFRIFFNWEIETCNRYPHLITNSYNVNENNMWLVGIPLENNNHILWTKCTVKSSLREPNWATQINDIVSELSCCPSWSRTFIKNKHFLCALLHTLSTTAITGEYFWPLES